MPGIAGLRAEHVVWVVVPSVAGAAVKERMNA